MSTLTIAQGKAPQKPAHCIVLRPTDFSDDWPNKPSAEVAVGLRRISDLARQTCVLEATRFVKSAFVKEGALTSPEIAEDEWNNAFIREACAAAMCDPNDVTRPYFVAASDVIGRALPPDTIAKVWGEYHRFVRRTDAAGPKATDEDTARLARLLAAGRLGDLEAGVQTEVRRLLAWCLSQLGDDDVTEDEEDVYVVKGA